MTGEGRAWPVIEIFGPTIQGEGPQAGRPAYFVRFGGCDFRCAWCDSMHAVDPQAVRDNAVTMTATQIVEALADLEQGPDLVVLSGGNPALHELGELVRALQAGGGQVSVETQGSRWAPWLGEVDFLVVSPKPPSAQVAAKSRSGGLSEFMNRSVAAGVDATLKVVVFDETDLQWAAALSRERPEPLFLSAGTDVGLDEAATITALRVRYAWLCEAAARRSELRRARVLPQLHVVAWGTATGV